MVGFSVHSTSTYLRSDFLRSDFLRSAVFGRKNIRSILIFYDQSLIRLVLFINLSSFTMCQAVKCLSDKSNLFSSSG